jgi:hypothetical protein
MTKLKKAAKKLANDLINSDTVDLLIVASLEETIDCCIDTALRVLSHEKPMQHEAEDFWDCIRTAKAAIVIAGYYSTNDYHKLGNLIMKLQKSFKEIHGELDK